MPTTTKPGMFSAMLEHEHPVHGQLHSPRKRDYLNDEDMLELHTSLQRFEDEATYLSHQEKQQLIKKIDRMCKLLHKFHKRNT